MGKTVAVVTGGAGGIGKSIVAKFLSSGMAVTALDLSTEALSTCKKEFNSPDFCAEECDITCEASVQNAINKVLTQFGHIDILVNNAGGSFGISQSVELIDEADWDKVINLNLKGTFLCTKAVVPGMKEQKYGRIVNVSSMAGRGRSVLGGAPYSAAKAGIIGFTRHSSMALGQYGITINAVAPGTVLSGARVEDYWQNRKTEEERQRFFANNPMGRLGTTEDIAAAVFFLSSPEAGYITGAVLDVNGGSWVG